MNKKHYASLFIFFGLIALIFAQFKPVAFTAGLATPRIPVLMFHYVRHVDPKKDLLGYNLSIEPERFEEIMK